MCYDERAMLELEPVKVYLFFLATANERGIKKESMLSKVTVTKIFVFATNDQRLA